VRRYTPLKPSRGTTWPEDVRRAARLRDRGCIGPRIGMPESCFGEVQLDHVRASGGLSMKSPSTLRNAASLCFVHHHEKTMNGRRWRPVLLEWIAGQSGDCGHVDPVFDCDSCQSRTVSV
jgi:hypothetical protein